MVLSTILIEVNKNVAGSIQNGTAYKLALNLLFLVSGLRAEKRYLTEFCCLFKMFQYKNDSKINSVLKLNG